MVRKPAQGVKAARGCINRNVNRISARRERSVIVGWFRFHRGTGLIFFAIGGRRDLLPEARANSYRSLVFLFRREKPRRESLRLMKPKSKESRCSTKDRVLRNSSRFEW